MGLFESVFSQVKGTNRKLSLEKECFFLTLGWVSCILVVVLLWVYLVYPKTNEMLVLSCVVYVPLEQSVFLSLKEEGAGVQRNA
jgi:hypothetical protein